MEGEIVANSNMEGKTVQNNNKNDQEDEDFVNSLPVGYRFCPTDEELVEQYLLRKINGGEIRRVRMYEVDLYDFHPDELADKYQPNGNEWYFLTPRVRKYPNGKRPKRTITTGKWKATGKPKDVECRNENQEIRIVGEKRSLAFFENEQGNKAGLKTNWLMHEYVIKSDILPIGSDGNKLNKWVLCKIYKTRETIMNNDRAMEADGAQEQGQNDNHNASPQFGDEERGQRINISSIHQPRSSTTAIQWSDSADFSHVPAPSLQPVINHPYVPMSYTQSFTNVREGNTSAPSSFNPRDSFVGSSMVNYQGFNSIKQEYEALLSTSAYEVPPRASSYQHGDPSARTRLGHSQNFHRSSAGSNLMKLEQEVPTGVDLNNSAFNPIFSAHHASSFDHANYRGLNSSLLMSREAPHQQFFKSNGDCQNQFASPQVVGPNYSGVSMVATHQDTTTTTLPQPKDNMTTTSDDELTFSNETVCYLKRLLPPEPSIPGDEREESSPSPQ